MANSYSTADILKGTLQRVGEVTDGTSPQTGLALKYINRAYSDILKGNSLFAPEVREVWPWARQTSSFMLQPVITGSATMTLGSPNGTFQTVPTNYLGNNVSLVGYNFNIVNGNQEQVTNWYTIAQHVAGSTSFVLDFQFLEGTGTMAFRAPPLTVTLPQGCMRIADPLRQFNTRVLEMGELPQDMGRIYYQDVNKFWEMWPLELILNDIPSRFCVISSSDSNYVLRFNKYVSNAIRVDYDYIPVQPLLTDSTNSIPLVPFEDRDVLEIMAAYYMFLDKKQPTDADNYLKLAMSRINAMKMANQGQQKLGKTFGQIIPRLDDTAIPFWLIQQR